MDHNCSPEDALKQYDCLIPPPSSFPSPLCWITVFRFILRAGISECHDLSPCASGLGSDWWRLISRGSCVPSDLSTSCSARSSLLPQHAPGSSPPPLRTPPFLQGALAPPGRGVVRSQDLGAGVHTAAGRPCSARGFVRVRLCARGYLSVAVAVASARLRAVTFVSVFRQCHRCQVETCEPHLYVKISGRVTTVRRRVRH